MDRVDGSHGRALTVSPSARRSQHRALGAGKPAPDLELEAGARAHFDDPLYYSDIYDWRDEDAVYYRALAEERGAVLEHAVGNGRVALPLARAGIDVTGLDHSRPMLDHLTSGYVQRAADRFPKQGDREPWINPQDYAKDRKMFRKEPVDDGVMVYSTARVLAHQSVGR